MSLLGTAKNYALSQVLNKPFYAQLFLTTKCNLKCASCNYWRSSPASMSPSSALRAVDFLKSLNVSYISFVGGEPSLREDLPRLIKQASPTITGITTNGTANNSLYKKCFDNGIYKISFSIDSYTAKKHDHLRGKKGVFKKCVNNLKRLSEKGYNVNISTTVSSQNFFDIDKLIDLAERIGVKINLNALMTNTKQSSKDIPFLKLPRKEARNKVMSWQRRKNVFLTEKYANVLINSLYGNYAVICKPFSTISVHPNGSIGFCGESSSKMRFTNFNWEEYNKLSLKQINSCQGCSYGCYFNASNFNNVLSQIKNYVRTPNTSLN